MYGVLEALPDLCWGRILMMDAGVAGGRPDELSNSAVVALTGAGGKPSAEEGFGGGAIKASDSG